VDAAEDEQHLRPEEGDVGVEEDGGDGHKYGVGVGEFCVWWREYGRRGSRGVVVLRGSRVRMGRWRRGVVGWWGMMCRRSCRWGWNMWSSCSDRTLIICY
jgi:hypothetical protein